MTETTESTPRRIVVVGASQAGLAASRELRKQGHDGPIVVLDNDAGGPYRRPEVSKGLLSGVYDTAAVAVRWPTDLQLDFRPGISATALDPVRKVVHLRDGSGDHELGYDGLVIASGAIARPLPGMPTGVHTLRTAADAERMRAELDAAQSVVIVGGGFIGLEVASVARTLGKDVTVLELAERPLERVLGSAFGEHLAAVHRSRGVDLRCGTGLERFTTGAEGRVSGAVLSDGTTLPTSLVLVAIGSQPAVGWLAGTGVDGAGGVRCDATCAVEGLDAVVAAGDVAEWWNPLYERRMRVEHWTNAIEQGVFAARRLLGRHDPAGFASAPYFWSDQWGVRIQSLGSTTDHDEVMIMEQAEDKILVAYGRAGRLVAVAGMDTGSAVNRYRKAILDGATLASVPGIDAGRAA